MRWLLIGYMFLFIHRPFEVWPVLGTIHLERIYMLLTLAVAAFYPGKRWLPNAQHLAYILFALAVVFCWLASPWATQGQPVVEDWFKILVFYFLLVLLIHDERGLRQVLLAFLVIMALYMLHSLREYLGGRHVYRMGIARMVGVDSTMGDPNSFGATIIFALPFVLPFWRTQPSRSLRWFLAGYVALSFLCVALTGSRSSLLGLVLWTLITVLRSRWRGGLLVLVLLTAPVLWAALPPSLQNRFETIVNPEVGPANAIESGKGRLLGLQLGVELWGRNPVTGIGPGAWRPATKRPIESHNLYGQLLGEMGTVGAIAFAGILLGFWANLRRLRRAYRDHPEWGEDFLYEVTRSVGLAVLLLLFLGNFGHNLFRYSWLWYGGFLIIAHHCVRQREQTEQAAVWDQTPEPAPEDGWGLTTSRG
jgi:O-antigen ligase